MSCIPDTKRQVWRGICRHKFSIFSITMCVNLEVKPWVVIYCYCCDYYFLYVLFDV